MTPARRCISLLQLPPRCGTRVSLVSVLGLSLYVVLKAWPPYLIIPHPLKHTVLFSKLAQARPCRTYSSTNELPLRDSQASPNSLLRAVKPHIRIAAVSTNANDTPSPLQNLLTHVLMRKELDVKEDMLPPEHLTPERRLMRMYETLYIMFSYIRQNADEEAGMHSLHVRIIAGRRLTVPLPMVLYLKMIT
jgi:hypothetical protein